MRKVSSISVLSLAAVSSLASAKCPVGQSYLTVKVVSADLSRCTDSTTGPDTYVTVSVLDDGVKTISPMRTKIVGNNADPEWDQKLEFGCVTHDAPIVFNVKDHDYSAEEPCLGPIEIQGWPSTGEEQQVCSTAPALLMGAPSDCLNYVIYYVRGTTSPDTTTDGEQAAIGIMDPMFPPPPTHGDSEPVEVIPVPPPVEEPIGVDVPASDETINDPFVNPSSARPSSNNNTEKPGQQEQIGETHRHPVDPIQDPLPTDQENTSVVSQKKPGQHQQPAVQNVTTIPDPSMSQPALGKDGHLGHGSSKIDNGHSTGESHASSPSSSHRAKKGLKGDKLTGAISGSIVAVLVMAAAAFTAFFLTRRSRRYDLELHDDVPPTPQAHPHLEAAGVHANQQTAV